ncbi:MAG: LacI family transcriptional regulator, partial [Comamonadaceae bacterium]
MFIYACSLYPLVDCVLKQRDDLNSFNMPGFRPPSLRARGVNSATPVTRNTVAARAGVSTAVVSYVLNNGPRPVAAETRDKVLRAIAEMGYRPNTVARALRSRRTMTLGLLVPDSSNPYFAELAKALEDSAFDKGYALLMANSSNDAERELSQLRALVARQVDGLLVVRTGATGSLQAEVPEDTPLVLLDRAIDRDVFSSVTADNFGGARAGVEHLISHGHHRIGCISGPADLPAARDRERGWAAALSDAKLQADEELVFRSPFSREGGYFAAQSLLALSSRPTAVFASSDLQAVGALRACHEAGLRIPEDIAVVSFDGTLESEFTWPPLTVVQQSIYALAQL